jgi:hypothetical protein
MVAHLLLLELNILQKLMRGTLSKLILGWIRETENEESSDGKRRGNLPSLVVLHAHLALLISNIQEESMSAQDIGNFVGSLSFVRGHHCYGQTMRNIDLKLEEHADPKKVQKVVSEQLIKFLQAMGVDTAELQDNSEYLKRYLTGDPVWFIQGQRCLRVPLAGISQRGSGFAAPPAEVPEDELSYVIAKNRRLLVNWLSRAPTATVDKVLQTVIQIGLRTPHFEFSGWTTEPAAPGLFIASSAGIMVDIQCGEVLYRAAEIRPVPESMAAFADFEQVFGREALQCAYRFEHKHRRWVEIVGDEHELMEWDECDGEDQGVGAPFPSPMKAFGNPNEDGTAPADSSNIKEQLMALQLVNKVGVVTPAASLENKVIGVYFSAHWFD